MAKKEVVSRLSSVNRIRNSKAKIPKPKDGEDLTPAEKKRLLPTYSEKYEELLIKQLFEEELKRKAKEESDEEESDYYEDFASFHKKNRNGF